MCVADSEAKKGNMGKMADRSVLYQQTRHDDAALEIIELANRFGPEEAMAVLDLARARLAIQDAVSRRLEKREKDRLQDAL